MNLRAGQSENPEPEDLEPILFDLADGAWVRVRAGFFWARLDAEDRRQGLEPMRYFAIRIYSDEGTFPRKRLKIFEFRAGKEFERRHCSKIWSWLYAHSIARSRFDHEAVDDFLAEFGAVIAQISAEDEDLCEHVELLPSFTLPDDFDQIDDSIFNDQEDREIFHPAWMDTRPRVRSKPLSPEQQESEKTTFP